MIQHPQAWSHAAADAGVKAIRTAQAAGAANPAAEGQRAGDEVIAAAQHQASVGQLCFCLHLESGHCRMHSLAV